MTLIVLVSVLSSCISFALAYWMGFRRGYRLGRVDGQLAVAETVLRAYERHHDAKAQAEAMDRAAWSAYQHRLDT